MTFLYRLQESKSAQTSSSFFLGFFAQEAMRLSMQNKKTHTRIHRAPLKLKLHDSSSSTHTHLPTMVVSPPSTPPAFTSTLDVNAPPFYPSMSWYPAVTDEYYDEHPHSPGSSGFVIADAYFPVHEIPDEELFDAKCHPLTTDELAELEQVDEINAMLADLDLMELYEDYEEHMKPSTGTSNNASLRPYTKKTQTTSVKHSSSSDAFKHPVRGPKKTPNYQYHHVKKNVFAPIQQPRSVK